jgi:hypothetical protein
MKLGFRLLPAMRCSVCHQLIDVPLNEDRIECFDPEWSKCPSCGQIMELYRDEAYKARCREFVDRPLTDEELNAASYEQLKARVEYLERKMRKRGSG